MKKLVLVAALLGFVLVVAGCPSKDEGGGGGGNSVSGNGPSIPGGKIPKPPK